MNLRLPSICLFALIAALPLAAQQVTRYGLVAGYHGFEHQFLEIGGGFTNAPAGRRSVVGGSLSAEMRVDESFILGATCSIWTSSNPLAAGFSVSYFNDLGGKGTLRFRPEVGIGLGVVRIVYGFSMELGRGNLDAINRHDVAIRAFVPLASRL